MSRHDPETDFVFDVLGGLGAWLLLVLAGAILGYGQGNPNVGTLPPTDESLLVGSSGFSTTLVGNISSSDLTITVANGSGLLTPGGIIIDFLRKLQNSLILSVVFAVAAFGAEIKDLP